MLLLDRLGSQLGSDSISMILGGEMKLIWQGNQHHGGRFVGVVAYADGAGGGSDDKSRGRHRRGGSVGGRGAAVSGMRADVAARP